MELYYIYSMTIYYCNFKHFSWLAVQVDNLWKQQSIRSAVLLEKKRKANANFNYYLFDYQQFIL